MNIPLLLLEVTALVGMSAIASGLNVALMSLDVTDLKRKAKLGDKRAKSVLPLRRNSHLSLASILLTNVAVISATSLVLDTWLSGLMAGIISTFLIVVFGEVIPQAVFTRHALAFTARVAPLLRLMIIITYPASKSLQLLLDKLLGKEITHLESRQELGIIISEHSEGGTSELDVDEVGIMRGALSLSEKRVRDIMTPIKRVFWLMPETVIDGVKIDELKAAGHSRIPILDSAKTRCYGILLLKDLLDIDFDDRVYRVSDFPLHPTVIIGSMTALDTLFRKFINAHSHLMPVERDDKIVGVVTIEDLIEEIIGHEIEDESDPKTKRLLPLRGGRRLGR